MALKITITAGCEPPSANTLQELPLYTVVTLKQIPSGYYYWRDDRGNVLCAVRDRNVIRSAREELSEAEIQRIIGRMTVKFWEEG